MANPKTIDWKQLDSLIGIQCTGEECAAVLDIDYDTLNAIIKREKKLAGFSEYFKLKRGRGKASLRRRQFKMAENNPTMAIWLGKQYLGQADKNETNLSGELKITGIDVVEHLGEVKDES